MVTFQELINNKGDEFINRLFTLPVTVYEKLDASQFSFEIDEDGNFSFYKQDQNTPISKIDITLSQYYNNAIKHFQNLPLEKIKIIPTNWRFCCEYFIDKNPVYISYDKMPKNGLVLINIIDNSKNSKKVLDNKNLLDEWADFLEIENPPLIFQGLLSESQKNKIVEFIRTPNDRLKEKFETNSFIRHLLSILNPDKSSSFLRDSDRGLIEGVVFRFDNDSENYTAKILDPVFYSRKIENNTKKSSLPSDIYWLNLLDIVEFLQGENISNYNIEGESPEERYLSLICSIFNDFIQKYGNKYKDVDFELPKFMQKEAFKVGLEYIPNKQTSKLITSEESWENVFKVILAAFRKKKKGTNQFFTEYVLNCFNSIVQEISDLCSSPVNEADDNELGILTFDEMKRYGKIHDVKESEDTIEAKTQKISKKLFDQFKLLSEDGQEYDRELKKVCVMVDSFEIFTNDHLKRIEDMQSEHNNKVVLVNIRTNYNLTQEEVQIRMLNSIEREYNTLIEDVVNVRSSDISEIIAVLLSKGYEPEHMIVQNKDKDYFEKQLESADLHGSEFSVITLDKDPDYKKLYNYIINDLWSDFRKHVPIVVLNYFEAFKIS
jgi:hypothetical protein